MFIKITLYAIHTYIIEKFCFVLVYETMPDTVPSPEWCVWNATFILSGSRAFFKPRSTCSKCYKGLITPLLMHRASIIKVCLYNSCHYFIFLHVPGESNTFAVRSLFENANFCLGYAEKYYAVPRNKVIKNTSIHSRLCLEQ